MISITNYVLTVSTRFSTRQRHRCLTSTKIRPEELSRLDVSSRNTWYDPLSADDYVKTRMWANAQRDGRPAEYRWRPLFNATKFG